MARERVITGEAVELDLPIARLGTRAVALAIDAVAEIVLLFAITLAGGVVLEYLDADEALLVATGILSLVFVFLICPVAFETLTRGRSPGKFALGLRVVRDDGGPIRFRHAFVRGLVGLVLEWPGLLLPTITWMIGGGTILFSSRAKRIGDLAAGTMVLQERLPDRGRFVAAMPPSLAPWAKTVDLSGVDDDLAMTIRQFLSRAHELSTEARASLGHQLVEEVMAVTTPPPPAGTGGWWYLAAIIAERRTREERRLTAIRPLVSLGPTSGYHRELTLGSSPEPTPAADGTGYLAPL